jgi:hypothetical protein
MKTTPQSAELTSVEFSPPDPKKYIEDLKKFNDRKRSPAEGDTGFLRSNSGKPIKITNLFPDTFRFEYLNSDELPADAGGVVDFASKSEFVPDADTEQKIVKEIFGETSAYSALTEFMNPTGNAIVKSFESAGGKGLAGFIDNMSFDWYDKVTWEIDSGRTAPKMCKITISFSPVHDITPGIDHLGYNRAPIYGVGAAMNSTSATFSDPGGR